MTKKLIQALEPRMMLDGAAVATAIDSAPAYFPPWTSPGWSPMYTSA